MNASPPQPQQGVPHQADTTAKVVWIALPIQFFAGGAVLGVAVGITLMLGSYDGFTSIIGAAIFGPILAGIAMVLAFLIGLPLRLIRPLRHWWVLRGWQVAIVCAAVGVLGMVISFIGPWASDVYASSEGAGVSSEMIREPNTAMYFGSLGLAALGLCHLMRPMKRVAIQAAPASARQSL